MEMEVAILMKRIQCYSMKCFPLRRQYLWKHNKAPQMSSLMCTLINESNLFPSHSKIEIRVKLRECLPLN